MGGKQSSPFFVAGSIIHSVMLTRQAERARTKVQQQQQRRDSRLKPRQSLTSGEVTHHASFRQSISGDAATFSCLSPSEAEADVKSPQNPLFFLLFIYLLRAFHPPSPPPTRPQLLKESLGGRAAFATTGEKPMLRFKRDQNDLAVFLHQRPAMNS